MSLSIVSAEDFLAETPETLPWVIEPLCVEGSNVMVYGRQKVGKSSAIMQLIHSLTTGEPWMGFPVRRTGKVLYLQLDMAAAELRRVMERAESAGMSVREDVYLPALALGEHVKNFNIIAEDDARSLRDVCRELQPIAVIVDTINDAYEHDGRGDVNAFIRTVVRAFRAAIGGAVLVFLNHKRKQMQNWKGEELDDEDGFLGGSAWEGVVSASLELRRQKSDGALFLELRALRLESHPAKRIPLKKTPQGFFEPIITAQMMLAMWPGCLPAAEAARVTAALRSKQDVFRDIAERTDSSVDAVRKAYQRSRGANFPWEVLLVTASGDGSDNNSNAE